MLQVDLKTPSRPPAFAFVEFEDPRDAYEAVRGRDGYDFAGGRLRVSPSCPVKNSHAMIRPSCHATQMAR